MPAEKLGSWLVTSPQASGALGLLGALYLLVMSLGFVVTAYIAGPAAQHVTDPPNASLLARRATIGMVIFGVGLFFLGMRLLQIDQLPFGWPIWLIAPAFANVLYLVQCLRWWRSARTIPPLPSRWERG